LDTIERVGTPKGTVRDMEGLNIRLVFDKVTRLKAIGLIKVVNK
jgi:hypothetical protein